MSSKTSSAPHGGEIVVYEAHDGLVRIDVHLDRDTVWLIQQQMAELLGRERSVVAMHIRNVFRDGELDPRATCANFAQVQSGGASLGPGFMAQRFARASLGGHLHGRLAQ